MIEDKLYFNKYFLINSSKGINKHDDFTINLILKPDKLSLKSSRTIIGRIRDNVDEIVEVIDCFENNGTTDLLEIEIIIYKHDDSENLLDSIISMLKTIQIINTDDESIRGERVAYNLGLI